MVRNVQSPPSSSRSARGIDALRNRLLDAQFDLHDSARGAVLLLATGLPLAGRTEAIGRLVHWLNPKLMGTYALEPPPGVPDAPFFRWWPSVPPLGRISVVYDGWYEALWRDDGVVDGRRARTHSIAAINAFEALLASSRIRLVKLHFHVGRDALRRRLHHDLAHPERAWRVGDGDIDFLKHYDARVRPIKALRAATDRPRARWQVVDGADGEHSVRAAAGALLTALRSAAAWPEPPAPKQPARTARRIRFASEATPAEARAVAARSLEAAQGELALQSRRRAFAGRSLIVLFEGMDAAGKSQAIRRVTEALDPRQYAVIPVGVPTAEERALPYLHRFWRTLPGRGGITLYDRSWYGRVLVERVEGLCDRADWIRAGDEIRRFEADLVAAGAIVVKFWLSGSREEQLARFRSRADSPTKRFKVDPRDWQARRRWWDYQVAVSDMLRRTHAARAPWVLVPADDKRHARHAVIEALCRRLRAELGPV